MQHFTPQQILEGVTAGVQVILANGTIIYSNPAAVRLLHLEQLGISERGLFGDWQVVDIHSRPMKSEDFPASEALVTGQETQGVIGVAEAGKTTWLDVHARPVMVDGLVTAVIVSFENITERQELARMKDMFIQNVSHELRTPLSPIYGYAGLLNDGLLGDLTPEQTQAISAIFKHASTLRYLLNQHIAMVQSIAVPRRSFTTFDAAEMVVEMIKEIEILALHERGLTIKRGRIGRRLSVVGDPLRLHLAILNVIENALKFTPAGGTITISCQRNNGAVVITVADTGIGIAAEEHGRIFEAFYQANGSMSRTHGGMGLGLAVAKVILEAHNGRIEVESELGQGATFRLILPGAKNG